MKLHYIFIKESCSIVNAVNLPPSASSDKSLLSGKSSLMKRRSSLHRHSALHRFSPLHRRSPLYRRSLLPPQESVTYSKIGKMIGQSFSLRVKGKTPRSPQKPGVYSVSGIYMQNLVKKVFIYFSIYL